MIDLPFNPDDLGDTMLARYLRADPGRLPVLKSICTRLDDNGRVGDRARYYVIRDGFRRAVLRGVLICEAIPLPSWLYETPEAGAANRDFLDRYRDEYNQQRREKRQQAKTDVQSIRALARTMAARCAA